MVLHILLLNTQRHSYDYCKIVYYCGISPLQNAVLQHIDPPVVAVCSENHTNIHKYEVPQDYSGW